MIMMEMVKMTMTMMIVMHNAPSVQMMMTMIVDYYGENA